MAPEGPFGKLKKLLPYAVVALAYFLAARFGLALAMIEEHTSPVWIPTGIAIGALLIGGIRLWPAIFVGALVSNLWMGGNPFIAMGIAAANTLEAVVATYLVNRFAEGARALDHPANVVGFAVFAGIIAPAVSATVGVGSLFLAGVLDKVYFLYAWMTWWVGDLVGALLVAPFILAWFGGRSLGFDRRRFAESVILLALISAVIYLSFTGGGLGFSYLIPTIFIWGAFRIRGRGMTLALVVLAELSLWGTLRGYGPFVALAEDMNGALILFAAYIAIIAVTTLALTATVVEHHKMRDAMAAYTDKMSQEKAVDAAIITSIGDGLVVTDHDGVIALANSGAAAMLGRTPEEMVGKRYEEVIPMQDEERNVVGFGERPLYDVLKGKHVSTRPLSPTRYYVRKDGSRFPVSFTKTPVVMGDLVIGAIEVFRDVTTGKEIDRAKSEFVSLASHQLRTPLSIISMYSELLLKEGDRPELHDGAECREYATEIHAATKRMTELINDLLNVSRIDAQTITVAPHSIDLRTIADDVIAEVQPKARDKKIDVERAYDEHMRPVVTDGQIFRIVVQNVIANAVKYTPRGGRITVAVTSDDERARLAVADTGYGIPRAQQSEVFKKLFRADNARKIESDGSGLGLYIARSMMNRLGGDITFHSEEHRGSTFVIELPLEIFAEKTPELA